MSEVLLLEYLKLHLSLFPMSYRNEAGVFSRHIEVVINPAREYQI